MTDYISREAVYQFGKEQLDVERGAYSKGRNDGLRILMSAARNPDAIPAADVRPVVKCKECAFWEKEQDGKCSMFSGECAENHTPPDGYCFAGIRREDANK